MVCENLQVSSQGHLLFAGHDTVDLAEQYGTPAYFLDEERIRHNCRVYRQAMAQSLGQGSEPLFASKSACFKRMYEIMAEENMSIDLVSSGEIYTALQAGFPMERSYFHGNNKTDADIAFAMDAQVGTFIVDSLYELKAVQAEAERRQIRQNILLRLTPGIDPHTYEAVATGKVDSKFGAAIETGQAEAFVDAAVACPNVQLMGYHCHVGSQVFDEDGSVYRDAAEIMVDFLCRMNEKHHIQLPVLNLGGGYGVRYVDTDPPVDIPQNIRELGDHIRKLCQSRQISMPRILLEPGRSIVADAGLTLYRVGTVKEIPGYKNYVSVDGGMTDNPRYALYESCYTVLPADRMDAPRDFVCDLVGRCCESGDIVQPHVQLPKPERGDLIAVCTTGAYNYSMASNYNRIPRPPVVMLTSERTYLAVKRETFADLTALDV